MSNFFFSLLDQISGRKNEIKNLAEFEVLINYRFKNTDLAKAALSHTSLISNGTEYWPYERMEFLGDSILGLIVSDTLFHKYPKYSEGDLSKLKSKLVSKKYLSYKAREIDLGRFILMSGEAELSKGRESSSILCDTIEAIICAIYLDSNLEQAGKFIKRVILSDFAKSIDRSKVTNYKSILQEHTQSNYRNVPTYKITKEVGPDHAKTFTVIVTINNQEAGTGVGSNKKNAQQEAAKNACLKLKLIK
ncbi:MAG: ribonuclease III [Candidatus Cloacimonadales bacterium]